MNRQTARLIILDKPQDIATCAAGMIVEAARNAIHRSGRFSIALSGGSTPTALHTTLASDDFRDAIDWQNVLVFWGDERFIPRTDAQSNFRMARETLLSKVPIPESNIYPVTIKGSPEDAAEDYARTLRTVLGEDARLDLILLGLGEDGHTASLFPGQCEDFETDPRIVLAVHESPKPPPVRITLGFAAINRARQIIFLVSGSGKHAALTGVFDKQTSENRIPARAVAPQSGTLVWLVDHAAYYGSA
jgi:6-phosphogluconolactonase